jgi:hypothetical protein
MGKACGPRAAASATTGNSVQAHISTNNDTLKIATLVQQIMTELREAVLEKDIIMIITKMVLNVMKQTGC